MRCLVDPEQPSGLPCPGTAKRSRGRPGWQRGAAAEVPHLQKLRSLGLTENQA